MYGFIDMYNTLREDIVKMIHVDPSIMGDDSWLAVPLSAKDITLTTDCHPDEIRCSGHTYTMQTGGCNEYFNFTVKRSDIQLFQLKQSLAERAVMP